MKFLFDITPTLSQYLHQQQNNQQGGRMPLFDSPFQEGDIYYRQVIDLYQDMALNRRTVEQVKKFLQVLELWFSEISYEITQATESNEIVAVKIALKLFENPPNDFDAALLLIQQNKTPTDQYYEEEINRLSEMIIYKIRMYRRESPSHVDTYIEWWKNYLETMVKSKIGLIPEKVKVYNGIYLRLVEFQEQSKNEKTDA